MKNKKTKRTLLALLLLASCLCCTIAGVTMSACGVNHTTTEEQQEDKPRLSAPTNLAYFKTLWELYWDKVPNATSYTVDVEGEQYTVAYNYIDLTYILSPDREYTINVYANDNTKQFASSTKQQKYLATTESSFDDLTYTLLEDGSGYSIKYSNLITKYTLPTRLILPDEYNGKPIKEVADCCFAPEREVSNGNIMPRSRYVKEVNYIRFPKNVQVIQPYAFKNFTQLTSLVFPKALRRIEERAFEVEPPLVYGEITESLFGALDEIVFNEGLELIGDFAFRLTYAKKATITANTVRGFWGAYFLKKIDLKEGVQTVGTNCFYSCSKLDTINFPKSLSCIGATAFDQTPWWDDQEAGMCIINDILYRYKQVETEPYTIKEFPSSVKRITGGAFYNCDYLQEVEIPDRIAFSGIRNFMDCFRLERVKLPQGLTKLDKSTFEDCSSLQSFTVPDTIQEIGERCFFYCKNMTEFTLGKNVTKILFDAFGACKSLTTVYYEGQKEDWDKISITGGYIPPLDPTERWSHNQALKLADRYYYSELEPAQSGNYWHYLNGVATKW